MRAEPCTPSTPHNEAESRGESIDIATIASDRDAILRRIHELRDEIAMLDRQNRSYSQRTGHSIYEQQMHTSRAGNRQHGRWELPR